ncbi:AdipoR/hemolysin-III-related protein [Dioscorea alata]|uniref:AdipoR/hemolysin-III-related protein n=1 Tax=Dioscorea alata TaxID=55571 RepID=A0ACB7WKC1_DIOAL|nr:AdipoR/hemolysin-III-related protein [Dioscorea alata]
MKNTSKKKSKEHKNKKKKKIINNNNNNMKHEKIYKLLRYEELPEYMKENEFILDHYRAEWPIKQAVGSIFSWHNETINVWTHLLGFFLFLALTLVHLRDVPQVANLLDHFSWYIPSNAAENSSYNQGKLFYVTSSLVQQNPMQTTTTATTTTKTQRWPFFIFLTGSMFCLLSSSACHLFSCHSRRLNLLLIRFDYAGIAVMIVTSFFPPIYYIFQCDTHWQLLYLSSISLLGLLTVANLFSPHLSTPKFRSYRASLFAAMAFSGIIPAIHAAVVNWNEPKRNITLAYELAMALFYVIGTLFYVSRVPERWKPGLFDVVGQSHQIFHVFVIAGALAHYAAALVFLEYRDAVGCFHDQR